MESDGKNILFLKGQSLLDTGLLEVLRMRPEFTLHMFDGDSTSAQLGLSQDTCGSPIASYQLLIADHQTLSKRADLASFIVRSRLNLPILCIVDRWLESHEHSWLTDVLGASIVLHMPLLKACFLSFVAHLIQEKSDDYIKHDFLTRTYPAPKRVTTLSGKPNDNLSNLRTQLRHELENDWCKLKDTLSLLESGDFDSNKKLATLQSHRLRGTAGSLGLAEVSLAAGQIEDLLEFCPLDSIERELVSLRLDRCLSQGTHSFKAPDRSDVVTEDVSCCSEVLIISDSQELIAFLHQLLDHAGFSFSLLCQASKLPDALDEVKPRLVIAGPTAHGLYGPEILRMSKELHPEITTLQLLGQAGEDVVAEISDSGVDSFFQIIENGRQKSLAERISTLLHGQYPNGPKNSQEDDVQSIHICQS